MEKKKRKNNKKKKMKKKEKKKKKNKENIQFSSVLKSSTKTLSFESFNELWSNWKEAFHIKIWHPYNIKLPHNLLSNLTDTTLDILLDTLGLYSMLDPLDTLQTANGNAFPINVFKQLHIE